MDQSASSALLSRKMNTGCKDTWQLPFLGTYLWGGKVNSNVQGKRCGWPEACEMRFYPELSNYKHMFASGWRVWISAPVGEKVPTPQRQRRSDKAGHTGKYQQLEGQRADPLPGMQRRCSAALPCPGLQPSETDL